MTPDRLLPGFTDAHIHPVQGGLERMHCDLSAASGRDDCLRLVRQYADRHPDRAWILGGGWRLADFPGGTPTAAELDTVVPDRPVFLPNRDHHSAWVNSRALEVAGVSAGTPDPADGRIERAADGSPSGTLHEGAMTLVGDLPPPPSRDEQVAALLEAQRHLHSLGITGWQDAIVGHYANLTDPAPAYLRLAEEGGLTARAAPGRAPVRTVPGDQREDHAGRRAGELQRGDARAVREALDAFEAPRAANGPGDHRHPPAWPRPAHAWSRGPIGR